MDITKEPTQEQIKELWEWCGFRQLPKGNKDYHFESTIKIMDWIVPNGSTTQPYLPRIDLNNLFKYAVPKLQDKGNLVTLEAYEHKGFLARVYKDCFTQRPDGDFEPFLEPVGEAKNDDPALALFWAIWEIIHGH